MSELLTPATDRRGFFKRAGLGVVTASAALQACDSVDDPVAPEVNTVTIDFRNDTGVLNYAYALEQLEYAFYVQVTDNAAFGSLFNEQEQTVLRDLRAHEGVHRDFLKAALGDAAIPDLTPDFRLVNFADRTSILTTAIVFEDLGVAAYNGAGQLLTNPDLLTVAGKIVSVEARHASAIRDIILGNVRSGATVGEASPVPVLADVINATALDRAIAPALVLTTVDPYITETLRGIGL